MRERMKLKFSFCIDSIKSKGRLLPFLFIGSTFAVQLFLPFIAKQCAAFPRSHYFGPRLMKFWLGAFSCFVSLHTLYQITLFLSTSSLLTSILLDDHFLPLLHIFTIRQTKYSLFCSSEWCNTFHNFWNTETFMQTEIPSSYTYYYYDWLINTLM